MSRDCSHPQDVIRRRHAGHSSSTPARVLYVSTSSLLDGGAERSLVDLLACLDRGRYAPSVALPSQGSLSRELQRLGVEFSEIPALARIPHPRTSSEWIRAARRVLSARREVSALLRILKPSWVHANGLVAGLFVSTIAAHERRLIWHVRDLEMRETLVAWIARRSDLVIVPSSACHDAVARLTDERKIRQIPNGIHLERFGSALRSRADTSFRILVIAQLAPWKHHELAIAAVAVAARSIPQIRLTILGSDLHGSTELASARLRELAERLGLGSRVELPGQVDHPEKYLAAADVLLHLAYPEAFGRSVVEAMAAGVPVVALAGNHGPDELLRAGTGALVSDRTPDAVGRILCELYATPELRRRLGNAGAKQATLLYDRRSMTRAIEDVYAE